jgi:hypothetical protein
MMLARPSALSLRFLRRAFLRVGSLAAGSTSGPQPFPDTRHCHVNVYPAIANYC